VQAAQHLSLGNYTPYVNSYGVMVAKNRQKNISFRRALRITRKEFLISYKIGGASGKMKKNLPRPMGLGLSILSNFLKSIS
jgi:hypothetical protein